MSTYIDAKYSTYVFDVIGHEFLHGRLGKGFVVDLVCLTDNALRDLKIVAEGIHVHVIVGRRRVC